MDTSIEHWIEWKKKCDVRLCSDATKGALHAYISKKIHSLVSEASARTKCGEFTIDWDDLQPERCWDSLDSYSALRGSRTGKKYKDEIFAKLLIYKNKPSDIIESNIHLRLRDIIRLYVKENAPEANTYSLDAPISDGEGCKTTYKDLLSIHCTSPADEATNNEALKIAAEYATKIFEALARHEKIVFAAQYLSLPLSGEVVQEVTGYKKSVLSSSVESVFKPISVKLSKKYPDEDQKAMIIYIYRDLKELCYRWSLSETSCAPLFYTVNRINAGTSQ